MAEKNIEPLLEKKIGLSVESVGPETIAKALQLRMRACGLTEARAYLSLLRTSKEEWEELIEAVVVPETWFFRNRKSFTYLGLCVKRKWLSENDNNVLRVLSIASSTGDEPYSIAMALLDAGLPEKRFSIVALDISKKALKKARLGLYGPESFRGNNLSFRERYFEATPQGYQLHFSVMRSVHLVRGNVLEGQFMSGDVPYDIIFCRNLLIYLSPSARKRVMEVIDRLLARTGILFVGHAERPLVIAPGLQLIREAGVFAFNRAVESHVPKESVQPNSLIRFERRRHKQDNSPVRRSADIAFSPSDKLTPVGHNSYPIGNRRHPPTEEVGLLDQARKLADKGALEEALSLCDKVLDQDMVQIQAHYLRGLICLAMNNEKAAEEWLNKTLYLDPNHHNALNHLTLIVEHRGDRERSAQLRQRAKRIRQEEGIH